MKIVILAAGYATRLYPLTLTQPKPLLPVAGRPMIDYVVESLAPIQEVDRIFVVTNNRFAGNFEEWAARRTVAHGGPVIQIVNDGSTDDKNKLGAIGDLDLVIRNERVDDDVIVVAGDNLFNQRLGAFGEFCRQKNAPVLGTYDVGSLDQARKYGVVAVDGTGRILKFEEKPEQPPSTHIGIALYYYPKAVVPMIRQYVEEKNNPDQPGRLIQWLYPRTAVYTWEVPGIWYDIGSKETLEEASRIFASR